MKAVELAKRQMAEKDLFAYVKQYFSYCDQTGMLHSKKRQSNNSVLGKPAGWQQPNGYWRMSIQGKSYQAHRLVWLYHNGKMPLGDIDHINGVKNDNRIENLRDVTHKVNTQNRNRAAKNNKLGVMGVTLQSGKYVASIWVNGKSKRLGTFDDLELAEFVYQEAKHLYHEGCVA